MSDCVYTTRVPWHTFEAIPIATGSSTNLPLQILSPAGGGRDGNKPKLRRFNSHDTSANMFSVAEFENARLARRNELENAALLRQRQQRYKLNSLSSGGGDCSTGESKGSKLSSNEPTTEPLLADQFLERFSLPRVIRLSYTSTATNTAAATLGDQTMTSSSSAESSSTAESRSPAGPGQALAHAGGKSKSKKAKGGTGGDLFLLYRYMRNYRSYHVFNTKAGTNRKKGYKIPQDFPGYFSFINDKGAPTATIYTTVVQLVRDQVYKFLSLENLSAYTESQDTFSHKTHYVKATAKAGQVYRLLAVFQDGDHKSSSSSSHKDVASGGGGAGSVGGREKERGKYAQLLDDNRQIYYVSLSAKGKFYEIEQHRDSALMLQKHGSFGAPLNGSGSHLHGLHNSGNNTSSSSGGHGQQHHQANGGGHRKPKQLSRDCVHRIGFIMQSDVSLPLNLKLISPLAGMPSTVPEYVTIAKASEENFIIACPLDEQQLTTTLTLTKLHLTPQMKFAKCTMGFENEQHMFLNANVQTVLKFCQFTCDNFLRLVESETNALELLQMQMQVQVTMSPSRNISSGGQQSLAMMTTTTTTGPSSLGSNVSGGGGHHPKESSRSVDVLRKFGRLFGGGGGGGSGGGHDRNGSGHEKEDSIIFLTKNDLESLECSGRAAIESSGDGHQPYHQHHSLVDDHHRALHEQQQQQKQEQQPHSLPATSGGLLRHNNEKMKVFTPNGGGAAASTANASKKASTGRWFKGLGRGTSSSVAAVSADDEWDKRTSLDRYKDMSKLIQERFGTLGMLSSRASSSDVISGGGSGYDDAGNTLVSHNPSAGRSRTELEQQHHNGIREKCLSLQHIEQKAPTQAGSGRKNKPDLVPPHHVSGSLRGDDDQEPEDDGDLTASELGDTLFFPLRHSTNQQSFMTQKLYSEFHVKTKQYSKSSSSIQQLLHLATSGSRPTPAKNHRMAPPPSKGGRAANAEVILSFEDLRYMHGMMDDDGGGSGDGCSGVVERNEAREKRTKVVSLQEPPTFRTERNILDDLPYSCVRDSILQQEDDGPGEPGSVPTEGIYAEICTADSPTALRPPPALSVAASNNSNSRSSSRASSAPLPPNHPITIVRPEKRFVSIRINVPPCDSVGSGPVSLNPAGGTATAGGGGSSPSATATTSRCSSAVSSPIEDNIYNTIK
uniref:CABIT domain-containing protein n=1 Tax=Anopheles atroparvus TaxID=41427 RepID=A0A182JJW9_ANOAO